MNRNNPIAVALLAVALATGMAGGVLAQSLAGSEGDKRYPTPFPNSKDRCAVEYRKYVAHGGHAAYAQSAAAWGADAFFCSIARGRTKVEAENRAVAGCQSVGKRYKMKTLGTCAVYASK